MIPGDLLSAFPHRQFHTLPGLLDSWAALPNSYPNALRAMQGGSLYHFYDGLWYDPAERSEFEHHVSISELASEKICRYVANNNIPIAFLTVFVTKCNSVNLDISLE